MPALSLLVFHRSICCVLTIWCVLPVRHDLLHSFKHLKFRVALNVKLGKQTITEEGHVLIRPWFVSNAQTCYARGSKRKLLKALREILQFFDFRAR